MITVNINGLIFDAGPTAGGSSWICQSLEGWFSSPPMRGSTDDRPVGDGAFGSVKNYRSARALTFAGTLLGASQSDAQQTLYDAFSAIQTDGVPFPLSVTTDLGTRSITVTLDGIVDIQPYPGLAAATATANFIAYDPVKYGTPSSPATGLPTAGGGLEYNLFNGGAGGALYYGALGNLGRITLTNNGTAPTFPTFTVTGQLTSGFYIQCLETGQVIQYSSIVPLGTTITLDPRTESVAINGVGGGGNFLTRFDWFSVPPKTTYTVQVNAIGGSSGTPTLTGTISDGFW